MSLSPPATASSVSSHDSLVLRHTGLLQVTQPFAHNPLAWNTQLPILALCSPHGLKKLTGSLGILEGVKCTPGTSYHCLPRELEHL